MAKLNLIISDLRRRIIAAGFKPGDKIPTQKELARELGVSVVTVGQAMLHLQEEGLVTATRGKGTVVNKLYSVPSSKSKTYGLIVSAENINDPTITLPIKALQSICSQAGHVLHMLPCGHARVTRSQIKAWAKDIRACFVVGTARPDFVQTLGTLGKPVIFHGEFHQEPCPAWAGQITVNVEGIALMCLQFLRSLGHKNILLIRSGGTCYYESLGTSFKSSAEYLEMDKGLDQWIIARGSDGMELLEHLRGEYRNKTALIVDGGIRASRILHSLTQNGIRVPKDLSLLALNGVEAHLLITPDLSRIEPMHWRFGEKLLAMAETMIESDVILREYITSYLYWGKTCRSLLS